MTLDACAHRVRFGVKETARFRFLKSNEPADEKRRSHNDVILSYAKNLFFDVENQVAGRQKTQWPQRRHSELCEESLLFKTRASSLRSDWQSNE